MRHDSFTNYDIRCLDIILFLDSVPFRERRSSRGSFCDEHVLIRMGVWSEGGRCAETSSMDVLLGRGGFGEPLLEKEPDACNNGNGSNDLCNPREDPPRGALEERFGLENGNESILREFRSFNK